MSGDRVDINLDAILPRIREKIVSRGAVGIQGLGRLFRIADDDSSRAIDLKNELPKLTGDIGLLLRRDESLRQSIDRNSRRQSPCSGLKLLIQPVSCCRANSKQLRPVIFCELLRLRVVDDDPQIPSRSRSQRHTSKANFP
jgi:hypothetical protein